MLCLWGTAALSMTFPAVWSHFSTALHLPCDKIIWTHRSTRSLFSYTFNPVACMLTSPYLLSSLQYLFTVRLSLISCSVLPTFISICIVLNWKKEPKMYKDRVIVLLLPNNSNPIFTFSLSATNMILSQTHNSSLKLYWDMRSSKLLKIVPPRMIIDVV